MHYNKAFEELLKLDKCPDKSALLQIKLDAKLLKEIDFDTISQISSASKTLDDDAGEQLNRSFIAAQKQNPNQMDLETLQQHVDQLQQDLHEKEEQCNVLLSEVQQYRKKSDMLLDQVSQKDQQLEKLKNEIVLQMSELKNINEAKENEIREQKGKFEVHLNEISRSHQIEMKQLAENASNLAQSLKEREKQFEALKSEESIKVSKIVEELAKQKNENLKQIQELMHIIETREKQLIEQKSNFEIQWREMQLTHQNTIQNLSSHTTILEKKIKEKESQCSLLISEIQQLKVRSEILEVDTDKKQEQIMLDELVKQIQEIQKKLVSKEHELEDQKIKFEELNKKYQNEVPDLAKQKEIRQSELMEKEKQCNLLFQQIQQYKTQNEMLLNSINRKEEELSKLKNDATTQISELSRKLAEKEQRLTNQQIDYKAQLKEFQEIQNKNQQILLHDLEKESQIKDAQCVALMAQVEQYKKQSDSLIKQIGETKKLSEQQQKDIQHLTKLYEEKGQEIIDQKKQYESYFNKVSEDHRNQIKVLEERILINEMELEKQSEVGKLYSQIRETEDKKNGEIRRLQQELKKAEQNNQSLQKQVGENITSISPIGLTTTEVNEINQLKLLLKQSQESENLFKTTLTDLNEKHTMSLDYIKQLEKSNDENQRNHNVHRQTQQKELIDLQKNVTMLKTKCQILDSQYEQSADQLVKMKCQIGDLFNAAFDFGGSQLVDKLQSAIGIKEI